MAMGSALTVAQSIVIESVAIVDPRSGTVKPNQTIRLAGNKAMRIDGRGKFLIPGLWDMHTHVGDLPVGWEELFLANGIVGIREMACSQKNWPAQQLHRERNVAPYLVSTLGAIDRDGPLAVPNSAAAPAMIDRLVKLGVDFLKVYNALSREAYFAIAVEARKRHLPLTGHIPDAISAVEAAGAGQRSIEHMDNILLACSTAEVGYRKLFVQDGRLPKPLLLNSFSKEKAEALADVFVAKGTWMVPTLTELRNGTLDASALNDPHLQYMEKDWRSEWKAHLAILRDLRFEGSWFEKHREVLKIFDKKGVRILAGTDSPYPFCVPGFALHDEMELLVGAGISAPKALAAATTNVTEFLERDYPPAYVLLSGNPLTDIRNTRKIEAVIVDGRVLLRSELESMLAATKERADASR